jgi:hypothetical protein
MMEYHVEFWRGDSRVRGFPSEEHWTIDEATQQVRDLLHGMVKSPSMVDWTGCRFEIARSDGRSVVQVPIMRPIGSIARQVGH